MTTHAEHRIEKKNKKKKKPNEFDCLKTEQKLEQPKHTYRIIDKYFILIQKDGTMVTWAQQRWNFQQAIFLFSHFIFTNT